MSEIIDKFYTPLLTGHGFIRDPDNQQYGDLGICWKLSPEVGEGTYWTYGQKDLYDIKIHNFSFHEDFMLEFSLPECLSITRYDSISGEELSPYRRLSAGCIKTFIGGYTPYKALIHKNIPIRSIGIEIAPAYYEDYLKKLYPEAQINPVDAFRKIDQTSDFPEMSRLLTEIKDYRGEGIAAKLFYEGKVAEAVSMIVEYQKKHPEKTAHKLSQQDIASVQTVASYLSDHYASDIPLERLTQIACMGTTKLKTCFNGNNKAENLFQKILRLHYHRVHPAAANEPGRVSAGIYRADGGTSSSDRRIFHFKQVCGTVSQKHWIVAVRVQKNSTAKVK